MKHASMAGDGGNFPASKYNETTSHIAQYRDPGCDMKTGEQVETKYKLVNLSNCQLLSVYWYIFKLKLQYKLIINYRDHTLGLHWDNKEGTNIITDSDKKVFELYLVGAFPDVPKVCCFHQFTILIWLVIA